jgi:hypothetical protein
MHHGTFVQASRRNKMSKRRDNPFDFFAKSSIAVVNESHRMKRLHRPG